jgi:predicted nucleic acid-binding protein
LGAGLPAVTAWLSERRDSLDEVATSVVSVAEVYSRTRPDEESRLVSYFAAMSVLPLRLAEARAGGQLRYALARRGIQLHLADSLIAATAILSGATVVTANEKDFRAVGVAVVHLGP